jgi:hypothetical protein
LRASDYLALFREVDFDVWRKKAVINDEARKSMGNGFMVDKFRDCEVDDLCVTGLMVALKAGGKGR